MLGFSRGFHCFPKRHISAALVHPASPWKLSGREIAEHQSARPLFRPLFPPPSYPRHLLSSLIITYSILSERSRVTMFANAQRKRATRSHFWRETRSFMALPPRGVARMHIRLRRWCLPGVNILFAVARDHACAFYATNAASPLKFHVRFSDRKGASFRNQRRAEKTQKRREKGNAKETWKRNVKERRKKLSLPHVKQK